MKRILILGLGLLMLSACSSTKIADLSLIVPTKTTITSQNLAHATVRKNITGTDERGIFLIFPLGIPTFGAAVDNTLKNGGGEVLTNVQVTSKVRWYVLYGTQTIEVKGDVVKLNSGGYRNE